MTFRLFGVFIWLFSAFLSFARAEVGDSCPLLSVGKSVGYLYEDLKKLVPVESFVHRTSSCVDGYDIVVASYGSICQISPRFSLLSIGGIGPKRGELSMAIWKSVYSEHMKNAVAVLYGKRRLSESEVDSLNLPFEGFDSVEVYETDLDDEILVFSVVEFKRGPSNFDLVVRILKRSRLAEISRVISCFK